MPVAWTPSRRRDGRGARGTRAPRTPSTPQSGSITWPSESMTSGRVRCSAMRRSLTRWCSASTLVPRVRPRGTVAPDVAADRRRFGPSAPGEGTRMTTPSESPTRGADLVVVANRLPVRGVEQDGERVWAISPGGVVSALVPALRDAHGLWIGWAGQCGRRPVAAPRARGHRAARRRRSPRTSTTTSTSGSPTRRCGRCTTTPSGPRSSTGRGGTRTGP